MGIYWRPKSASLGDTTKTQFTGEKREAPPPERIEKKGKGSPWSSYSEATRSLAPKEIGEMQLVEKEMKKKDKERKHRRRSAGGTKRSEVDAKALSFRRVERGF